MESGVIIYNVEPIAEKGRIGIFKYKLYSLHIKMDTSPLQILTRLVVYHVLKC